MKSGIVKSNEKEASTPVKWENEGKAQQRNDGKISFKYFHDSLALDNWLIALPFVIMPLLIRLLISAL